MVDEHVRVASQLADMLHQKLSLLVAHPPTVSNKLASTAKLFTEVAIISGSSQTKPISTRWPEADHAKECMTVLLWLMRLSLRYALPGGARSGSAQERGRGTSWGAQGAAGTQENQA